MTTLLATLVVICITAIVFIAVRACKCRKLDHAEWITLIAAVLGGFGSLLPILPASTSSENLIAEGSGTLHAGSLMKSIADWFGLNVQVTNCRVVCEYSITKSEGKHLFGVGLVLRGQSRSGEDGVRIFVNSDGTWGDGYWENGPKWVSGGPRVIGSPIGELSLERKNTFEITCRDGRSVVTHNGVILGDVTMGPMTEAGTIRFGLETQGPLTEVEIHKLSVYHLPN